MEEEVLRVPVSECWDCGRQGSDTTVELSPQDLMVITKPTASHPLENG